MRRRVSTGSHEISEKFAEDMERMCANDRRTYKVKLGVLTMFFESRCDRS